MSNPLNRPYRTFDAALMNPQTSSRGTKDGPKYWVKFEIEAALHEWLMNANTAGMIIAAKCLVTDDGQLPENIEKPEENTQKTAHGKAISELFAKGFFRNEKVAEKVGTLHDRVNWISGQPCAICEDNQCYSWNDYIPSHSICFDTLDSSKRAVLKIKYLEEWTSKTLAEKLGYQSRGDIPLESIAKWARENGVEWCLPLSFREGK